MRAQAQLIWLILALLACQTSRKSDSSEPKVSGVGCEQELVLECDEGKVDRCSLFDDGQHECIDMPAQVEISCDEQVGFHCPENEVDRCTLDPKGNHECVPDPRLAENFPQACDKEPMIACPPGEVDACQLNSNAEHECVEHRKEYLIKFKTEQGLRLNAAGLPKRISGAKTLGQYLKARLLHVVFQNIDVVTSAIELAKIFGRDDVEYVVENVKVSAIGSPNDAKFAEQWSHAKVGSQTAWSQITGDRSVVVAVVDTGVDYKHPDLAANMYVNNLEIAGNGKDDDNNGYVDDYYGWDFFDDDNDPMDETSSANQGHGTHCAGIIGAVGNNGIGVVGSSQQVTIMPVRFLGPKGEGGLVGAVKAIDYAVENGADVISASFGVEATAGQVAPLLEAIERARDKGVLFVAAASNDGKNNDEFEVYPANAAYSNVISVAASDRSDGRPSWSNYGKKVSLAAPGHEILSTLPDGKYGSLSGTSMAAPMVAGAAALLIAKNRELEKNEVASTQFAREITAKPENLRSLLQVSGDPVGIDTSCNCRMNLGNAFAGLNGTGLFVAPASSHMMVGESLQLNIFGGDGQYTLTSTEPAVLQTENSGRLTALAVGEAQVKIVDGQNRSVQSFSYKVSPNSSRGNGACPLSWPRVCSIICYFLPDTYFCE